MKCTVTFETVIRDTTWSVVNRFIDETATKKFNTKREAVEYLRSKGFQSYSQARRKLPDFMGTPYDDRHMCVIAEID